LKFVSINIKFYLSVFQTVARHFKSIPVVEKEALTYFIYMAKNFKSRFDQKHNMDVSNWKPNIVNQTLILGLTWKTMTKVYMDFMKQVEETTDVLECIGTILNNDNDS
jgi:hypothetical protein